MTDPQRYPVEIARKKIADILDGTQFRGEIAEITRRDKRAGYLVPPEWYDEAVEALAEKRRRAAASPSAATDAPRQQVTQAVRKPVPSISPKVMALPRERIKELADRAQDHDPDWVDEIQQDYPHLRGPDLDLVIVELGHQKGFKIKELDDLPEPEPAGRPVTAEEAAEFAARARSKANEMQSKKLDQVAESAAEGSKDFAVMHTGLDMELLTHDEVYGPVSGEETTT